MKLIFSDRRGTPLGLRDQRNGSIICGRGLKNELYILQHEEASTGVIHGTSAAANVIRENHPLEENDKEISAVNGDLKDSAWLQVSSPEAKIQLLSMKLELLQEENYRTKAAAAAASESLAAKRELQTARLKIKHLKRRLRVSRAQARKKMESIDRKITEAAKESEEIGAEVRRKMKEREDLQNTADVLGKENLMMKQENMELEQRIESARTVLAVLEDPQVIGRKMKELEDLEDAAEDLGRTNLMMKQENKELEQRMESAKMLLSVLEHPPPEALEEINRLRESNAKLQKKIGRLEAKQKADAEELSQLRWLNIQLSEEFICKSPSAVTPKTGSKDRHRQQQHHHHQQTHHHHHQLELSDSKRAATGHSSLESSIDHWRKLKILGKFMNLVTKKGSKGGSDSFELALLDAGEKTGGGSARSSICSDERFSSSSSCATAAEDQSVTSPVEGSGADADERWSSNSAWINGYGASHGCYAAK